ncbi:hypothetical protein HWHPT5561_02205 [Petrotoga sp. HWH.PT.55.6.1]|uniref:hypothetical protein n=1 Tax=unclassified Petrotoga TaxID=2620614 RepID=UPI000CA040F9|nr:MULTISPECIES: hypothetical protein [unclassified Petrotoga]PNR94303.1 hypothetical protein X926_00795 [Petrotoga sp. HWHPT.55.6.3]RPD36389.1 hypothetical protein HWHPT5561_02205 [Petrotoga sp. HWH.PT.55.6.1]
MEKSLSNRSMKYLFILLLILIICIIIVFLVSKSSNYKKQIIFFEEYLKSNYTLEDTTINEFVKVFEILYKEFPYVTEYVYPIELLAIGIVETNFENVKGDSGDSLGYFQIQAPTYWYLKHNYPEFYQRINFLEPWYWDNIKERPDVQLLTSILYLYDIKSRFGEEDAYSIYNGGSETYKDKILLRLNILENELKTFNRR